MGRKGAPGREGTRTVAILSGRAAPAVGLSSRHTMGLP